jgi:hypothetical protein
MDPEIVALSMLQFRDKYLECNNTHALIRDASLTLPMGPGPGMFICMHRFFALSQFRSATLA